MEDRSWLVIRELLVVAGEMKEAKGCDKLLLS